MSTASTIFIGVAIYLVTIFVVGLLTQKMDPAQPLRNSHGEEVEFKDRLGTLPLFSRAR